MDTPSRSSRLLLTSCAIALAMTLAVGLLTPVLVDDPGVRWAAYVIGAGVALITWLGLFFGGWGIRAARGADAKGSTDAKTSDATTSAKGGGTWPTISEYASGAVVAVAAGALMSSMMDSSSGWPIGAIAAIVIVGGGAAARA